MKVFEYQLTESRGCCGLDEVHTLYAAGDPVPLGKTGQAQFATTVPDQKKEIKVLRKSGFKKVARWKARGTGSTVTMWFRKPSRK
jgi:hypothetical protein